MLVPLATYILVANPATYQATRSILGGWVANPDGAAKLGGLVLHAFVFVFLVQLLMRLLPGKSYAKR